MHNRRKRNFHWLNVSIRTIVALMMILPAFFPTGGVLAAPLLDENFDYGATAGDLTAVSGGNWIAHSGGGTNPIQYAINSLEMPSYVSSGTGGSATFFASGEDVNRTFASQSTGPMYFAAMVNLTSATTGGDYFLHFKNASTGYAARVFARDDASGNLQYGIGTSSTAVYSTTTFAYGTTYLVVAKHDMVTGASDVFVLDACSSTEPMPLASATGTALAPIVGVAIRQGSNTPAGTVDGIRVATTWADAATCTTAPPAAMTIGKSAPATVEINESFDYTISVGNDLGITANGVVITDSLPLSATFLAATPGYELLPGNVISWTISSIADGASAILTATMAAPSTVGDLVNFDYNVWASNWTTPTVGSSVTTTVIDPTAITPIATARAAGAGWNGTIEGNVTVVPGTFATRSFTIQDTTGGLYIYPAYGTVMPPMVLGDLVRVKGTITVYHGLLELASIESITWIDSGTVPDPLVTLMGSLAPTQGQLVQIEGTATSITPSGSHWSIAINDGSGSTAVYIYAMSGIDVSGFSFPMDMRVTGMSGAYDTPQVNPRYQSDIIDLRPPTVSSTNPVDGATGVNPYHPLTATFSKAMDALTLNATSFTLTGPSGVVSGTIGYDDATHTASFTPDAALSALSTYTATLTTDVEDSYGIPLATSFRWAFTTGDADTTPPEIVWRFPAPGAIDVPLRSSVVITFTEDLHPASLGLDHFLLEGPFGVVPSTLSYDSGTFVVTLDPDTSFLPTTLYTVTVLGTVTDWAGLPLVGGDSVWTFTTSVEPPMNVYFGDIHNHTGYSDGSGTPASALAAGEAAGFDFMAITDHSYAIDDTEWDATLAAVEAATDADFVALRGFEYTQGAEGHINVYNTVRHAVRTDTGCAYCDYTPNLEAGSTVAGFYGWLATEGLVGLDTSGTVMQFNHPGWINFNDWTYHPEVSDVARMTEVGNGNGTSYAFSEDEYIRALDYGWRVGAANNADTHSLYWGTNTDHRTGVLMTELTGEALLEALRERRTFATEDVNYALWMKANGAWMGAEIANSGSIQFEINGTDPDGELTALVEIITDQGEVAASYEPVTESFVWSPLLNITTGVHYFYVRVTQADGDRIVSSPVWTLGSEDIAITDVVIQPTIPTIYSPSLLTARVTNRVSEDRAVTVSLDVNGVYLTPDVMVTVPGNSDSYANFSWQPTITGEVTVTAHIIGAPAGDNPDDNEDFLYLTVTDEHLPLILIDAGHGNVNAAGREMRMFVADLSAHQYNVLKHLDSELTAAELDPTVVRLLIITAPQYAYTPAEQAVIADYVAAGGSLWLCGLADYTGKVPWADTVANRENAILDAIETHIGSQINMRMNDDEIIDADDNNGYVFGVIWSNFPVTSTTSIGLNVEALASWSLNSIRGHDAGDPLTPSTPGVEIVVAGDLDEGYGPSPWFDPYHTANEDADGAGDAYIYNPTWVYPNPMPPDPLRVPMAAVTDLPGDAGRIMLYGDSNDPFTTFAYTAGDGRQNELFNLESVMWLLGEPLQKSTIAEARAESAPNQPDNLDRLVWVEGEITAAYGEFFNVLYMQDATGGITVHAPAGDIDPTVYTRGTQVRVVGTVGIYNGDTEIEFFEAEMVQVIGPSTGEPEPLPMSTYQASLEENQGWLSVITGTVMSKIGSDTLFVDDGSGPVRIFLDGYNGDFNDIQVNDLVRVTGLVSEDGDGPRIRVRNYGMHPEYPDDVVVLPQVLALEITKTVVTSAEIIPGSLVTYTLVLSNTADGIVLETVLTDTLPAGVTFGGFVVDGGAVQQDGTVSWTGNVDVGVEVMVIFTATVNLDYSLYGTTITNTVEYDTGYDGSGSAEAAFTVIGAPVVTIAKSVAVPETLNLGDIVTYTLTLNNSGEAAALNLTLTDTLPAGVTFGGWVQQNGAVVTDGVITWNGSLSGEIVIVFTATVDMDPMLYGQTIINTVEFTSDNAGTGLAEAAFDVGTPELSIAKTVETVNDPVLPGDPITYTIVVRNDGTAEAVDVHIWDALPDDVIGSDVNITVTIQAGMAYTITIAGTLAPDAVRGNTIDNTAYYECGALTGEATASFNVAMLNKLYLPILKKN
jgi:uncharacterized repeat protein (TIGR01451 family)